MKRFLVLLFLAVPCMASGPKHNFQDALLNDEFDNVYHDIGNIFNISTVTYHANSPIKFFQIVMGTSSQRDSTTSTSFADTTLTATITPVLASHKILVIVTGNLTGSSAATAATMTVVRGVTNLGGSSGFVYTDATVAGASLPGALVYLDSPASASALTYKVQIRSQSAGTAGFGNASQTSVIILAEVGS